MVLSVMCVRFIVIGRMGIVLLLPLYGSPVLTNAIKICPCVSYHILVCLHPSDMNIVQS